MESEHDEEEDEYVDKEELEPTLEIMFYALSGWNSPQMIRLHAHIGKKY